MNFIIGIAILIVLFTIGLGVVLYRSNEGWGKINVRYVLRASIFSYILLIALFMFILMPAVVHAASAENPNAGYGFLAAGLSTGLATIGAGYAVGSVGSSALGAVSENPRILGKTLIFVGLAEGIAIYGLIISIIILGRL
ncbi:MAG: ATP synthase subunit C [Bacillota bacterium]